MYIWQILQIIVILNRQIFHNITTFAVFESNKYRLDEQKKIVLFKYVIIRKSVCMRAWKRPQ